MFGRGVWFGRNPAKKGLTITFLLSDGRPSYPNLIGIDKRDGGRRTIRQDYVESIRRVPLDADDAEHLARPGLRRCVTAVSPTGHRPLQACSENPNGSRSWIR